MFQVKVRECLLQQNPQSLVDQIVTEGLSSITLTCLDQAVAEDLLGPDPGRVRVLLKSLEILSEQTEDLLTLVDLGLVSKVVSWFNSVHDLLTSDLRGNSSVLSDLAESFYDYFLVLTPPLLQVSQISAVLLHLAQMGLDSRISFSLRQEAFRTYNTILESLSSEKKKLIQTQQNQNPNQNLMTRMVEAVLTVGDYELQASLSEILCRLTLMKDRRARANQWFSSVDVGDAFCNIKNGDFEVDCRRFLNFVNSCQGDQRVYTFPCLRAFLDSTQLFGPKDDKWDEFWIDFNLGSESVSFFIDKPQSRLWGSVRLLREEVERYSLNIKHHKCTDTEMVLSVRLNNPIMHQKTTGQTVELIFASDLYRRVEEATEKVFKMQKAENVEVNEPGLSDSCGSVQVRATKSNLRTYKGKKATKKLKVLPLSSPSSDEDYIIKSSDLSRAEFLFDQIKDMTATFDSGVSMEGAEPQSCLDQSGISSMKDVVSGRKRSSPPSGYLSPCTEGTPPYKRKKEEEPVHEGAESNRASPESWSPDVEETPDKGAELSCIGVEPDSNFLSRIRSVFRTFTEEQEQHIDICRQKVEAEVLQSHEQHVSALLTAVNQHRSVQLQMLQTIQYQLEQLVETSARLNFISEKLMSLFESEKQQVNSIYEQFQLRLKSLNDTESGAGHPSS